MIAVGSAGSLVSGEEAVTVLVRGHVYGLAVGLLQVRAHPPELVQSRPARAGGTGTAHSVTLTL